MDETLEAVRTFHEAFGCHVAPHPTIPELTGSEMLALADLATAMENLATKCHAVAAKFDGSPGQLLFTRLQLSQEELGEFARALQQRDLVGVLDALADRQYVLDGDVLALGLQALKLPAFREVQRSNMSKLGDDGRPIINEAGRVVKGPHYRKPRLKELMLRFFYGGSIEEPPR